MVINNGYALMVYKRYMQNAFYNYSDDDWIRCYNRVPAFRDKTFEYCWDYILENNLKTILELGTSRSFVDGNYEGCNSDDVRDWKESDPSIWDWGAGMFTRVFGELIQGTDITLTSVDLVNSHLIRCHKMTEILNNIKYVESSSENFLNGYVGKIDFLYMDTGDVTPIEQAAQLSLYEAKLIVEREVLSDCGIILIDDVKNITGYEQDSSNDFGKAKYSIPYFLDNGFKIIMDEYQVILRKDI
jgi:hypothetical protein